MKIYFDFNNWCIGYYRGGEHHYICPLPTVVICWNRKFKSYPPIRIKNPFDKILEEVYTKALLDMLNSEKNMLSVIEETKNTNEPVIFPIRTNKEESGARGIFQQIPPMPGDTGYITSKYLNPPINPS